MKHLLRVSRPTVNRAQDKSLTDVIDIISTLLTTLTTVWESVSPYLDKSSWA